MNEKWIWPYLDIQEAIRACGQNLEDVERYVEALLEDRQHQGALQALHARVHGLKAQLHGLISPEIAACIREEQAAYDEEEGEWQAHRANNYLP